MSGPAKRKAKTTAASSPAPRDVESGAAEDLDSDDSPPSSEDASADSSPPSIAKRSAHTPRREMPTLWQRATYRWTAITALMAVMLIIYTQHPYYLGNQFTPFRTAYTGFFVLWLALGLFYVRKTLVRFSGMRYAMRDSGLHLLVLARAWQRGHFWRTLKNPRLKTTALAVLVKGFFTPLMTGFVANHLNTLADAWMRHKHLAPLKFTLPRGGALAQAEAWWTQLKLRLPDFAPNAADFSGLFHPGTWTRPDLHWGLDVAYNLIFLLDCGWALMGYASESRWLGNKTRSVEPTAFGWVVCIFCYPPYNNILGTYLPLENGAQLITSETTQLALRAAVVFMFAIYASATVAFGFKFSNLTNRGIVSRGPYRYIRHPAYLCKCTAWWLEHIPTMTPTKAFFLTGLCGVYALRAWTEERHLGKDPDYRAYKKKTPWVILPGVY